MLRWRRHGGRYHPMRGKRPAEETKGFLNTIRGQADVAMLLRKAETGLGATRQPAVFGITFDAKSLQGIEALATVIRLAYDNLCLVERNLALTRRIMDVTAATEVTLQIVETA